MKKLLAITLAFVLVLSLSAVAFAAGSPTKEVTTDDLPAESVAVKEAAVKVPNESEAVKILVPSRRCGIRVAGTVEKPVQALVQDAVRLFGEEACRNRTE